MRNNNLMIQNVHFNQLVTKAIIECAFGLTGLGVMVNVFRIDLNSSLLYFLLNAPVSVNSITCEKLTNAKSDGHCLTENAMNLLIMRKSLSTTVLT